MDDVVINGNKRYDDNDMAIKIAWKKFEEKHPKELWPEWLSKFITISGTKSQNNNWLIKITALPKTQLKPNQHWEEKRGIPVLVEVDPITGKRSIVICGGPAVDVEVIFQVEIDLFKGTATVITDTDVEILDGTKYEIYKQ